MMRRKINRIIYKPCVLRLSALATSDRAAETFPTTGWCFRPAPDPPSSRLSGAPAGTGGYSISVTASSCFVA